MQESLLMSEQKQESAVSKNRRPILQYCVLCDGVAQGPSGKFAFVGVFALLLKPSTIPQFNIVTGWIDGVGNYTQTIRILTPQLQELIKLEGQEVKLNDRVNPATVITNFVGLHFEQAGVYWIEILLDGKRVLSIPFAVRENISGGI